MSDHDHDVAVLGAGPGGYVCAIRAAQQGLDTAIVEPEGLGGVCLNEGCIPSKALIHASSRYEELRHLGDLGIDVDGARIDAEKLQQWKGSVVDRLTGGVEHLLKKNGVTHYEGWASFESSTEIAIEDGEETDGFTAEHVVVATGSSPIELPFAPFDEDVVLSSTGALTLTEVPDDLLVIGGGYIGLELGTVYRKLGSQVTVVEMMDQLLPGTDPELVEVLEKRIQKLGITYFLQSKADDVEVADDGVRMTVETPDGQKEVTGDKLLVTVGRRPRLPDGIDETAADVDEDGFLKVDEQRRTTDPAIYAVGDVAGEPMLAHKASREGVVAAEAIAGEPVAYDNRAVPAVIFTDPEIAYVGMNEAEAKQAGMKVKVGRFPFAASGRAMTTAETDGFVKVVADENDTVVGAQMAGPHVSDLVAEAALAIEMGATLEDLAATIHAHPTLPETLMEAAEDALGHAIHVYRGS